MKPYSKGGRGFAKHSATSKAAAESATDAETQKERIRTLLDSAGERGHTNGELFDRLNAHLDRKSPEYERKHITMNIVCARTSEMKRTGEIVETGEKRRNRTGKLAAAMALSKNLLRSTAEKARIRIETKRQRRELNTALDKLEPAVQSKLMAQWMRSFQKQQRSNGDTSRRTR